MKAQNYKNHIRYYYPHHFVFYPIVLAAAVISASFIFKYSENRLEWIAITSIFIILAWLSFLLRQHYALMNQNRIVRLELRFRYYLLTGQRFEIIENRLSFGQLSALRFASDEELPKLVNRALYENLTADDIKKSVKNWIPDYMRV